MEEEIVKFETSYKVEGKNLRKITTPDKIVPVIENFDINILEKEISKIDGVIELWQNKKNKLQEKLDKYNELSPKEVVKESELIMEE